MSEYNTPNGLNATQASSLPVKVSRFAIIVGTRPTYWLDRQVLLVKPDTWTLRVRELDWFLFPVMLPQNTYMHTGVMGTASGDGLLVVGKAPVKSFVKRFHLDEKRLRRDAKELDAAEFVEMVAPFYLDDFAAIGIKAGRS